MKVTSCLTCSRKPRPVASNENRRIYDEDWLENPRPVPKISDFLRLSGIFAPLRTEGAPLLRASVHEDTARREYWPAEPTTPFGRDRAAPLSRPVVRVTGHLPVGCVIDLSLVPPQPPAVLTALRSSTRPPVGSPPGRASARRSYSWHRVRQGNENQALGMKNTVFRNV
jgi:hypothetical protein